MKTFIRNECIDNYTFNRQTFIHAERIRVLFFLLVIIWLDITPFLRRSFSYFEPFQFDFQTSKICNALTLPSRYQFNLFALHPTSLRKKVERDILMKLKCWRISMIQGFASAENFSMERNWERCKRRRIMFKGDKYNSIFVCRGTKEMENCTK